MGRQNYSIRPKNSFLKKKRAGGFSIIKILLLIAAWAAFIILVVMKIDPKVQLAKFMDNRRIADLEKIASSLEEYRKEHRCYPDEDIFTTCNTPIFEPYLQRIPCDPETGQPYAYEKPDCEAYVIYATMKTINSGLDYNGKGNYVKTSAGYQLEPSIN